MQIDAIPSDPNVRDTVIGILKQRFGDQFTTSDAIRDRHGNTYWPRNTRGMDVSNSVPLAFCTVSELLN